MSQIHDVFRQCFAKLNLVFSHKNSWVRQYVGLLALLLMSSSCADDVLPVEAPPAQDAQQVTVATPLAYTFHDQDEFNIDFKLTATLDGQEETTSGTCRYNVLNRDKLRMVIRKKQNASGTAFVITPDGLLITCAHVVAGADELEVVLNETTYQAKVLALDPAVDLAVLKIEAKDLPALSLEDSENVELGEETRVAGYPLSEVLGTSLKVSAGSVAGLILKDGQRLFQIDAAVNPGNSGGPVINKSGKVIGVASSRLSGANISSVGFCVPSNAINELLLKHKLTANGKQEPVEQDGPSLTKMLLPSVAFVNVNNEPEDGTHTVLRFTGHSMKSNMTSRGLSMPVFDMRMRMPAIGHGEVSVARDGEIVNADDEPQLPYFFGPPSQLMFFKLPGSPKEAWSDHRETSVVWEKNDGSQMFRRYSPFGRERAEIIDTKPAVETSQYKVLSQKENLVEIERTYDFHTTGLEGKAYKMYGVGNITFDTKLGICTAYTFKGTYNVETDELSIRVPVELSAKLTNSQDAGNTNSTSVTTTTSSGFNSSSNTSQGAMLNRPKPASAAPAVPLIEAPLKIKISGLSWNVTALAFTPNDKFILAGKLDNYIEVYSTKSGEKVYTEGRLTDMGQVTSLLVSDNGKQVVAGGSTGLIRIWNLAKNGLMSPVASLKGHKQAIKILKFASDEKFLLSGGSDDTVRCWDTQSHEEVYAVSDFKKEVRAIHTTESGWYLASDGNVVKTVDLLTGQVSQSVDLNSIGIPQQVAFSLDGKVVVSSEHYSLRRWESETGKELPEYQGNEILWDFTFNQDGTRIIGGGRGHLAVWDNVHSKLLGHINLDDKIFYVKPLTVSHDGKFIACYPSAASQEIYIFELPSVEAQ